MEIQVNNIHEILIVKCLYVELFSSILCLDLSHSHSGMGIRIISWEFIFLSLVSCNSKLKPDSVQKCVHTMYMYIIFCAKMFDLYITQL